MAETLVVLLVRMVHNVWPFPFFVLALAVAIYWIARLMGVNDSSSPLTLAVIGLLVLIPFGTPALLFFGSTLTSPLIYHYGVSGQAVVVAQEQTSNIFNDRPVDRYTVALQKADGEQVDTHFDSSDFNVYPRRNRVSYPSVGEPFDVRYLADHPSSFVILLEGDSPYARRLR